MRSVYGASLCIIVLILSSCGKEESPGDTTPGNDMAMSDAGMVADTDMGSVQDSGMMQDMDVSDMAELALCGENEHVQSGVCIACPEGSGRAAGDHPAGRDTVCEPILCEADLRVLSHACVACEPGSVNEAGDSATGEDTACDVILCEENFKVESNACVPCESGLFNGAGDEATGEDTMCGDACFAMFGVSCDDAQQAYVKASNADPEDYFGSSVAMSGDLMVVGVPRESGGKRGVNVDESDNTGTFTGAVYVYERVDGIWTKVAYIKASNSDPIDFFGTSVAIDGERIVVGAVGESSASTQINGDEYNNQSSRSGAAYVYERVDGIWAKTAYLKAFNQDSSDGFGHAVAISGDTIVVGAPQEDSSVRMVNGNELDNAAPGAGAAYVYVYSGGTWTLQAYLKPLNTMESSNFGTSVAISGDTVVVGAVGEKSASSGLDGAGEDDNLTASGAAYIFTRRSNNWTQNAYLKSEAPQQYDTCGISVDVEGDFVVVGCSGDQMDGLAQVGSAYVYRRSSEGWVQDGYLRASNAEMEDTFGFSVSISGERVLVGAFAEDSNARGFLGDEYNNQAVNSGAAYLFERSATGWSQLAYIKASNTDAYDKFGDAVSMDGDTCVIGALEEDGVGIGVNDTQLGNSKTNSGAVYVFEF